MVEDDVPTAGAATSIAEAFGCRATTIGAEMGCPTTIGAEWGGNVDAIVVVA